jgi:hypothetical protein
MRPWLLSLSLLVVVGCAHPGRKIVPVRVYTPWTTAAVGPLEQRWRAVPRALSDDGWRIVAFDERDHRAFAIRDHDDFRDHVAVHITAERTVVAMRTELKTRSVTWDRTIICSSYGYGRERALVEQIETSPAQ